MNTARLIPLVALLAFVAGFWTACSVGFDPTGSEHKFSCTSNDDCLSPNVCKGGVCGLGDTSNCTDEDGDGYGVGEDREGCELCQTQGRCEEDCNDNDASVNPGLKETCDGKDNNCDDEIDEPITGCDGDPLACPEESGTIPRCENDTCVYRPTNQLGECASVTLGCVGGEREDPPAMCQ